MESEEIFPSIAAGENEEEWSGLSTVALTVLTSTTLAPLKNNQSKFNLHEFAGNFVNHPQYGFQTLAVLVCVCWAVYLTLYNSRVQGRVLTALLRNIIRKHHISVGSFSISLLTGKVMFREIEYVTEDYRIRVVDGLLRFRYWLPYVKKRLNEDMSHCDHRLYVELNGLKLHVYNRSEIYSQVEKYFGLESLLLPEQKNNKSEEKENKPDQAELADMSFWNSWRDLIPVIKIDLNMARLAFGNRLVSSTLVITCDKTEAYYSTKAPAWSLDQFMHIVNATVENLRVFLAPSPKFTGPLDEPPRYMGEGFVVMASSKVQCYYYQDQPGIVPSHPQLEVLPSGEEVLPPPPVWGINVRCGRGTALSYGPWADRQRDSLLHLFFPQDYQTMKVSNIPVPGQLRQATKFTVKLNFLTDATIDVLFSKDKETKAVHLSVQRGSSMDLSLPWVVGPSGYTTTVRGQLLHLDSSTSLAYRSLIVAEMLDYRVSVMYPRVWNHKQTWNLELNGTKVTYHFLYAHKEFFQELLDDWSSKSPPDLYHFVPYIVDISLALYQFELVTLTNQYNWVDCSSKNMSNAHIAFCGEHFKLQFCLPFHEFLPPTVPLTFDIKGEDLTLSLFLPTSNTSRNIVQSLALHAKLANNHRQQGQQQQQQQQQQQLPRQHKLEVHWRSFCKQENGWLDCWQVPQLSLLVGYTYHPVPTLGPSPQANVSTPEKEELLLSPIRAPHRDGGKTGHQRHSPKGAGKPSSAGISSSTVTSTAAASSTFDPSSLPPDQFTVDLLICKPSSIRLYGAVLRQFVHLKENIFGEDQHFTDMSQDPSDDSLLNGAAKTVTEVSVPGGMRGGGGHPVLAASESTDQQVHRQQQQAADDSVEYSQQSHEDRRHSVEDPSGSKNSTDAGIVNAETDLEDNLEPFDCRKYRPFEVQVLVRINNVTGHLVKDCNPCDPDCPVVVMDSLVFEMHKEYHESRLQLLISPLILYAHTSLPSPSNSSNVKGGGGGTLSDVHTSHTNLAAATTTSSTATSAATNATGLAASAAAQSSHSSQQPPTCVAASSGLNPGTAGINVSQASHSSSNVNTSHGSSSGTQHTINAAAASAYKQRQLHAPGFVMLSGLQMRGHAMFSSSGRSLDDETLEYAWLVELTLGSLTGRVTAPQLQQIVTGVETFILTASDSENCLRPVRLYHLCYHDLPQPDCTIDLLPPEAATSQQHLHPTAGLDEPIQPKTSCGGGDTTAGMGVGGRGAAGASVGGDRGGVGGLSYPSYRRCCPTVDTIKYRMVRVSVDAVHVHLVDAAVDLNVQVFPVRFSTCNLHGQHTQSGFTAYIKSIKLRNYVSDYPNTSHSVRGHSGGPGYHSSGTGGYSTHSSSTTTGPSSSGAPPSADHLPPSTCTPFMPGSEGSRTSGLGGATRDLALTEPWLEAGSVSLGPLFLDAAVSSDALSGRPQGLQQRFLRQHDGARRKLWFLWSTEDRDGTGTPQPGGSKQQTVVSGGSASTTAAAAARDTGGRCGCVGGCSFFGNNRNGPRFFKFTQQDVVEGLNIAQYRINPPGEDIGYGQSLLHSRELVFNVSAYASLLVPHYDMYTVTQTGRRSSYRYNLSSGYNKCGGAGRGSSPLPLATHTTDTDNKGSSNSRIHSRLPAPSGGGAGYSRQMSQPCGGSAAGDSTGEPSHHRQFRSLGRAGGLRPPTARELSPGSLSDLRLSADIVVTTSTNTGSRQGKMPSSLSLQMELPLHAAAASGASLSNSQHSSQQQQQQQQQHCAPLDAAGTAGATHQHRVHSRGRRSSRGSLVEVPSLSEYRHSGVCASHESFHTMVHRTVSLGSEALSEAFYSADEDQVTLGSLPFGGSLSPSSSQTSLPTVPEHQLSSPPSSSWRTAPITNSSYQNSPYYSPASQHQHSSSTYYSSPSPPHGSYQSCRSSVSAFTTHHHGGVGVSPLPSPPSRRNPPLLRQHSTTTGPAPLGDAAAARQPTDASLADATLSPGSFDTSQEYDSVGVDSPTFVQSPPPPLLPPPKQRFHDHRRNTSISSANSSTSSNSSSTNSSDTSKEGDNFLRQSDMALALGDDGCCTLTPGLLSATTADGLSSSRTMLLLHSDSDSSVAGEPEDQLGLARDRTRHGTHALPHVHQSSLHKGGTSSSSYRHHHRRRHHSSGVLTDGNMYKAEGSSDRLSDVGSISSNSFLSAVSSQEDVALIDLHVHLSKPIIDCPLLLPSYRNHMTQLRCLNWECPVPVFGGGDSENEDGGSGRPGVLLPPGGVYTPTFEKLSEGFTAIRMVETNKSCDRSGGDVRGSCGGCFSPASGAFAQTPSHPYAWDAPLFTWTDEEDEENMEQVGDGDVVGGCEAASTSRTTLVVKLKKDVDVTVSPLALESANQLLESLTVIMEHLHPMTIINRAHKQSIVTVEAKNTLKKDRYMHWSRTREQQPAPCSQGGRGGEGGGRGASAPMPPTGGGGIASMGFGLGGGSSHPPDQQQPGFVTSTYEESCFQHLQGMLTIPRVNVTLLQASVVEAVISFSSLENTKDLTCVSLISVCLEDVSLKFSSGHQSNRSVQIVKRPPKLPGKQKKSRKTKNRQAVEILSQPVYIERCVKQHEENMMSISIGRTHAQLRRLKNESTLLQDADITAIPEHRSKVLFLYQRCYRTSDNNCAATSLNSDRMGFIMFEAGLEQVALKAIKRKGFGSSQQKKEGGEHSGVATADKKDAPEGPDNGDADNVSTSDNLSSPSTTINADAARKPPTASCADSQSLGSADGVNAGKSNHSSSPSLKEAAKDDVSSVGYSGDSEESGDSGKRRKSSHSGKLADRKRGASKTVLSDGCSAAGPAAKAEPSSDKSSANARKSQQEPLKKTSYKDKCTNEAAPPPQPSTEKETTARSHKRDITSFSGEIRSVWLNFAAPPHTPINRKIDYTRLDWNLLSTASPSINAWMNPSDRLTVAVGSFLHNAETRRLAVMASLMTEALDVPGIHVPDKLRYWKIQPVSQTLQEDPSCQLCNVLRRYLLLPDKLEALELNLAPAHLPKLATLRQAIIVLSRQWKNVLYIPSLMERTVRHHQPGKSHVTFKLSHGDGGGKTSVSRSTSANTPFFMGGAGRHSQGRNPAAFEGVQRQQSLPAKYTTYATTDKGISINGPGRGKGSVCSSGAAGDDVTDAALSSASTQLPPKHALPSYPMTSSRASIVFPIRSPQTTATFHLPKLSSVAPHLNFFRSKSPPLPPVKVPPPRPPPARRTGPLQQPSEAGPLLSPRLLSSDTDTDTEDGAEDHMNDMSPFITDKHHDLYTWMANQEDYKKQQQSNKVPFSTDDFMPPMHGAAATATTAEHPGYSCQRPNQADVIISEGEGNESPQELSSHGDQFLAAHIIFAPLLSSIGVQTQQAPARAVQQLGPNVCVSALVEALQVHIAESEIKMTQHGEPPVSKARHDLPAFLCQKAGLELDIRKVADHSWSGPALFVSRSALRRHTSTVINFNLEISYVSQQVNMPLLRLLHQITCMYKNAKRTQQGLRDQRPTALHTRKQSLQPHYHSQHFTDSHFQQPCSSSISEEQDHGTLSSIGGKTEQRESVGSSFSIRTTPPPLQMSMMTTGRDVSSVPVPPAAPPPAAPSTSSNVSSSRIGRPQSFAQRLRSSTKLGRGYMNFGLERATHSPLLGISISSSGVDAATVGSEKSPLLGSTEGPQAPTVPAPPSTPRCWRNVYCLLDLYTITPETKTLSHAATRRRHAKSGDAEAGFARTEEGAGVPLVAEKAQGLNEGERTPIGILGVAKIHRTRLLASLSGLKLEAQMTGLQSSLTFKEKVRDDNTSTELSVTGQVDTSSIVLLEGNPQQTVVRVTVAGSQALYSSVCRKHKEKNSALISIGDIEVKIPQHPVILHDMMTRGTKQLSTTLQELRVTRPAPRLSRGATIDEPDASPRPHHSTQSSYYHNQASYEPHHTQHYPEPEQLPTASAAADHVVPPAARDTLLQPLVVQFSLLLQSVSLQAALLPSLQAQYRMEQLMCKGVTGTKAKFKAHLPLHKLSFSTKLQDLPGDRQLPSEAGVDLPQVHVEAEYIHDDLTPREAGKTGSGEDGINGGVVMREGSYLNGVAEIGALEHSLTTDLLNHLVFVQKVFMKEVNEVVQKMAGGDKPVPLWSEDFYYLHHHGDQHLPPPSHPRPRELLFSLQLRLRGITMTGTTPTQSAVRLETGVVELNLSNRIDSTGGSETPAGRAGKHGKRSRTRNDGAASYANRIYGRAQVDVNLALGQLIRNDMFEEAEPELQQLAYFKTRINLRNAYHHELSSLGAEGEVVLISLTRPLVCVQPLAVDRAVLVWLNYRNAYDYWNEQRATLNKEVLTATQQVFEKVPQLTALSTNTSGGGSSVNGGAGSGGRGGGGSRGRGSAAAPRTNLFLQLTVDDLGVCLPLNPATSVNQQVDSTETRDALVMTLQSTSISACNSGSLVCQARFTGFCMRFAPEFETSLDEWKPELTDPTIMNLCTVSEGTYEVCSRTRSPNAEKGCNAKWLLHVGWQMEGVDLLLDVNIGKQLSALARTLTTITGSPDGTPATPGHVTPSHDLDSDEEEDSDAGCDFSTSQPESASSRRQAFQLTDSLPAAVLDPNLDPRQRAKLLEIEMNEQAKTVAALKSVGASEAWVKLEMRRLQELKAAVFYDFRKDVMQKLRRQSVKANSMRDRLGLAAKSGGGGHLPTSKSFRIPSPTIETTEPAQLQDSGGSSSDPLSLSLDESYSHTPELGSFTRSSALRPPLSPVHRPPLSPALIKVSQGGRSQKSHVRGGSVSSLDARFTGPLPASHGAEGHGSPVSDDLPGSPLSGGGLSPPLPPRKGGAHHGCTSDTETDTLTITNLSNSWVTAPVSPPAAPHPHREGATASATASYRQGAPPLHAPAAVRLGEHDDGATAAADCATAAQHGGGAGGGSHDPSIDLELDVQVCISSGQCILYNKDFSKDDDNKSRLKKERSFSGVIYDLGGGGGPACATNASSPGSVRRRAAGELRHPAHHHGHLSSSAKLRQQTPASGSGGGGAGGGSSSGGASAKLRQSNQGHATSATAMADCTVFFIPGLDVKVHYESHNESHSTQGESPCCDGSQGEGASVWVPRDLPPPHLTSDATNDAIRSKSSPFPNNFNSFNFNTATASDRQTPYTPANQTTFGATIAHTTVGAATNTSNITASNTPNASSTHTPSGASCTSSSAAGFRGGVSATNTSAPNTTSTVTPITAASTVGGSASGGGALLNTGKKHASLFTWLTLQSIPEETVICPNILDFLELALEPLPLPQPQKTPTDGGDSRQEVASDVFSVAGDAGVAVSGGQSSSFPVDVIVYFHMQPCTIRFSCQPVSRVECLLQLPSLNLVFSSKRANDESILEENFGTGTVPSSSETKFVCNSVGGLSVTGVLEDFSLFVFHPYGGKMTRRNTDCERRDSLSVTVEFVKFQISRTRKVNIAECSGISSKTTGDKFGKNSSGVPLDSACRAAIIRFSTIIDIGTALFKYDMRRLAEILAFPKAWYRRSIVRRLFLGDLGILSTVSEMMEEDESCAVPAAGPAASSSVSKDSSESSRRESSNSNNGVSADSNIVTSSSSTKMQHQIGSLPSPKHEHPSSSATAAAAAPRPRDKLWLNLDGDLRKTPKPNAALDAAAGVGGRVGGMGEAGRSHEGVTGIGGGGNPGSWETLVLFAANFTKLDVHMNMGNVMGNVVWTTKGFQANGRLSIGSSGHKDMYIGLGLGGSILEAKGGIVGGIIELSTINTYLKIKEDTGVEPDHTFGVKVFACQSRLDYMGTSVLMLRVSSCGGTLRDEWSVLSSLQHAHDDATRRGATIFIIGDLEWDQLQLLISKSTTADLLKMYHKLEEFFTQQFKSSRLVFFSLQPNKPKQSIRAKDRSSQNAKKVVSVLGVAASGAAGSGVHHHRYWQRVLARVSGLHLATLPVPLPSSGTVLGGSLELHGNTISLACFHGLNFKSKSWALFSLKEPLINFTTEVQETLGEGSRDTHIIQNLILSLGVLKQAPAVQHVSMATVLRVTRNMVFPPQCRTLHDWFHYAFYTSELDNVDRFPVLDNSRTENLGASGDPKRSSGPPPAQQLKEHTHSSETIFAFPSLEIHLNSKQRQAPITPDFLDSKPRVETSLVTEFQDHIFVTVDAENFFFLHDLISSYIKDTKDKMGEGHGESEEPSTATTSAGATSSGSRTGGGSINKSGGGTSGEGGESSAPSTTGGGTRNKATQGGRVNEPTQFLQQDWREFSCNTWHLEPTVRLLSWAAKNLDPYGVDYILHRLGFSQASTTIPKWLQRGCMDPLDKLLSLLMFRIITVIHDRETGVGGDHG